MSVQQGGGKWGARGGMAYALVPHETSTVSLDPSTHFCVVGGQSFIAHPRIPERPEQNLVPAPTPTGIQAHYTGSTNRKTYSVFMVRPLSSPSRQKFCSV